MALRINTNIAAMNSYRNLSVTDDQMSKSLEKLSSGFRINRAADDAAGLAISEGLRSQVSGLKVATRNAQDGISVVQTAEGALSETHSILQRMRDLSVQASNEGGLNDDAKKAIQSEVTQLKSELSRIAETTKFNGKALLDGSYAGKFQVGANAGESIQVNVGTAMGAAGLGVDGVDVTEPGDYTFDASGTGGAGKVTVTNADDASAAEVKLETLAGIDLTANADDFKSLSGTISFGGKSFDLASVQYKDPSADSTDMTAAEALEQLNTAAKSALGLTDDADVISVTATDLTFAVNEAVEGYTGASGFVLGGANATAQQVAKATATFTAATGADQAIKDINDAITTVSTTRADLGALQNRFEHTINNLNVTTENLSASESRIRDADMAQEMVKFTRNQILSQAGTSMLAQANQSSQGVLSLLR